MSEQKLREALEACVKELDRLKVAFACHLENSVEPPNMEVFNRARAALAANQLEQGGMSDTPDTFAALKKQWRDVHAGGTPAIDPYDAGKLNALIKCAYELETLERRVRELRDDCLQGGTIHHQFMAKRLTALLGEEPKP